MATIHRGSVESINSQQSEQSSMPQPKLTLRKSCDACAQAKVRCIRRNSECERCRRKCLSCTTSFSQRRGRGKRKVRLEDLDILNMDLFAGTQSMPSSPSDSSPSSATTPAPKLTHSKSDPTSLTTSSTASVNTAQLQNDFMDDAALWNFWSTTPSFLGQDTTADQTYEDISVSLGSQPNVVMSTEPVSLSTNEYDTMLSNVPQIPAAPLVASKPYSAATFPMQSETTSQDLFMTMAPAAEKEEGVGEVLTNLADAVDRLRETMEVFTSQRQPSGFTAPYQSMEESIDRFRRGSNSLNQLRYGLQNNYKRPRKSSTINGW